MIGMRGGSASPQNPPAKKKKTKKGKGILLGKDSPFNSMPILGSIL